MSNRAYSASESDASESSDNAYCIFLHIVEGVGLYPKEGIGDFSERHKEKIILKASLNGVKFEVEGHSTETTTIFNSNCIWECELGDIKRMKTDNRPVKLECYVKSGRAENSPRKIIGSVLLPIRGNQTIATLRNVQLKLHWHKLGALSAEWRYNKPELYLLLIIVKKSLVDNGHFERFLGNRKYLPNDVLSPNISETALMLQSQSNVYVQLLEQVGLIQVGNNPDIDCDIFNVTLTFKQVKNLERLLELERNFGNIQTHVFVFNYDFLGSTSNLEIVVNAHDCYSINEKISLSFKSSVKSLRMYFQRIFYIPINLYLNGIAIANYRFDFSKLLPDNLYFNLNKNWTKNGTFHFDRLHKILSPRALKPSVDFIFNIQLLTSFAKKNNYEIVALNETFVPLKIDEKAAGDTSAVECFRNLDSPHVVQLHKRLSYEHSMVKRNFNNLEMHEKNYIKTCAAEPLYPSGVGVVSNSVGHILYEKDDLFVKSSEDSVKELVVVQEKKQRIKNPLSYRLPKQTNSICVGTEELNNAEKLCKTHIAVGTDSDTKPACESVAVQTTPPSPSTTTAAQQPDAEELTLNIVQELEAWKAQQMEHFLSELERKETEYLADLDKQWQQQRDMLQARLETKIAKCEELNAKLEKTHVELMLNAAKSEENKNIAATVKREIESSYALKFQNLDEQMQRLISEMQDKGSIFQMQNKQAFVEQSKLEREKAELQERVVQLEKQLTSMEQTHLSAEQFKSVLNDLRAQTEHFAELEKSKNYYKAQWTKTTREVHKLKLDTLKQQEKNMRDKGSRGFDICLEEILNVEQEELNSDRTELKTIKELLFINSETASSCDFEEKQ